jgi:hypothetical protein
MLDIYTLKIKGTNMEIMQDFRLIVTSVGIQKLSSNKYLIVRVILQDTQNNGKINIYDTTANGCFERSHQWKFQSAS